jgi:hypothetical protein
MATVVEQTAVLLERIRNFAMPEGPVECAATWLKQRGEMRMGADKPWLPFEAEQRFEGTGIDFRWRAWIRMAPFVPAFVIDSFEHGRGALAARVFGFLPVASSHGPDTDRGEALRGLAELPWHPYAFRQGPLFMWESTAANQLRATFDDGRTRATVEFQVDADGRGLAVTAPHRPLIVGKSVVDTPWSGTVREYRTFDRLRVPTFAEVTWHLPEGPFTYWRGRVTDFKTLR